MSRKYDESLDIISRMRKLRSTGRVDVSQLHAQAERVTDWREHIKAQPVLSAIAASLVGYSVVKYLSKSSHPAPHVPSAQMAFAATSKPASAGLLALVGGVATSVARQWLTEYFKRQLGALSHAASQLNKPGQRSASAPYAETAAGSSNSRFNDIQL